MRVVRLKFEGLPSVRIVPLLTDSEEKFFLVRYAIERERGLINPDFIRINALRLARPREYDNSRGRASPPTFDFLPRYWYQFEWYNEDSKQLKYLDSVVNTLSISEKLKLYRVNIPRPVQIFGSIQQSINELGRQSSWSSFYNYLWCWDALGFDIS